MRALIMVHRCGSSLICVIAGPLSIAAVLRIFAVEPCGRFLSNKEIKTKDQVKIEGRAGLIDVCC